MADLLQSRCAPTWLLVFVLAVLYPWSWFVNQWWAANKKYEWLLQASDGLLYPNLQICLPTVIVWLVIWRAAGLRWKGRRGRKSESTFSEG